MWGAADDALLAGFGMGDLGSMRMLDRDGRVVYQAALSDVALE